MSENISLFVKAQHAAIAEHEENGPQRVAARKAKKTAHDALLRHMRAHNADCVRSGDAYATVRTHRSQRVLSPAVICDALRRVPPEVNDEPALVAAILEQLHAVRCKVGHHVVITSMKGRKLADLDCRSLVDQYVAAVGVAKGLRQPRHTHLERDAVAWMEAKNITEQPLNLINAGGGSHAVVLKTHVQQRKQRVTQDVLGGFVADAVRGGGGRDVIARAIWESIGRLPKVETSRVRVVPQGV